MGTTKEPGYQATYEKTGCAPARDRLIVEKTHSLQGASLNTWSPSIEHGKHFAPWQSILAAIRGTVPVM
jgi:hypothetical protein